MKQSTKVEITFSLSKKKLKTFIGDNLDSYEQEELAIGILNSLYRETHSFNEKSKGTLQRIINRQNIVDKCNESILMDRAKYQRDMFGELPIIYTDSENEYD